MLTDLPIIVNYRGLAAPVVAAIERASDFHLDRGHVATCLRRVPSRMHSAIVRAYARQHRAAGNAAANQELLGIREAFAEGRIDVASSDEEIRQTAENRASTVRAMLALRTSAAGSDRVAADLRAYCDRQGVKAPDDVTLSGLVARLTEPGWWRRALRRCIVRACERACIRIGMVHRHASIYASEEAVTRRGQQRRRNAAMLASTEAVNEEGEAFTLAELSARNVSDPGVRRAELMTRIRGFEEWANGQGHIGVFVTWTVPSRMHARLAASGDPNPKYDGSTPRDAAALLARQWAKCRAAWKRRGLAPYGFRVAEPHHDGTPHWHMLLFLAAHEEAECERLMRHYAGEPDAAELSTDKARDARFLLKRIDPARGTAAGYIAKYIAKNIDGAHVGEDFEAAAPAGETAVHVDAWASTWGIRQFQQIGGPSVTVWRELRRQREAPQEAAMLPAWGAADAGDWRAYVAAQAASRVGLWKVEASRLNRYGEPAADQVQGVQCGASQWVTRTHTWVIRQKRIHDARDGGRLQRGAPHVGNGSGVGRGGAGVALPWTRVNNCTGVGHGIRSDGRVPGELEAVAGANQAHQVGSRCAEGAIVQQGAGGGSGFG